MGESKQAFTFNVIVGAGTAIMDPLVHHARVSDTIRWVTEAGSMRVVLAPKQEQGILFRGSGNPGSGDAVVIDENTSAPERGVIEGTAAIAGTYYHTAIVWQGERPPTCAVGVLIIDPK
jgi:hypothetical protein